MSARSKFKRSAAYGGHKTEQSHTRQSPGKLGRLIAYTCLTVAICISTTVQAKDCADEGGGAEIAQCFEARYIAADKELNRIYSSALKDLSGGERKKLIEAQRAWVKYRDAGLAFMLEANKDTRSYGSIVVGDYKATVVEKRVRELKFILASPADPVVSW